YDSCGVCAWCKAVQSSGGSVRRRVVGAVPTRGRMVTSRRPRNPLDDVVRIGGSLFLARMDRTPPSLCAACRIDAWRWLMDEAENERVCLWYRSDLGTICAMGAFSVAGSMVVMAVRDFGIGRCRDARWHMVHTQCASWACHHCDAAPILAA